MTQLDEGFAAQARSLREFGYSDVTADRVREAHTRWLAAEPPTDVIDRFCFGAFDDHPRIFGEPSV